MRVLVTSMGSTAAQNLVWALRRDAGDGWFVVGADAREVHGGVDLPDVAVTVPPGRDPGYVEALVEHVRRHEVDVVVPVMEPELAAVAGARSRFPEGSTVLVSSPEAVAVAASKRLLAARLEEAGLDPPRVLDPATTLDFPVFVRPESGSGSRGARVVRDRDALDRALAADPGLVVSEHVEGEEHSVDAFADHGGAVVHAVCRRREEMRHGLAVRSTVVELPPDLRPRIDRLSRTLGLFGFFNLQFRRDAAGRARCFDLNPRLGGAMALSFAAGLDAPRLLRRAAGQPTSGSFETRIGLVLVRRWHNVIVEPRAG